MSRYLKLVQKHANRNTYDATNVALRTGQCVAAIIVAALSGADLGRWSRCGRHADSRWIYAEVVSVLSTLTALACGVQRRRATWTARLVCCVLWQALLSLLWVVVSAVYGQLVAVDRDAAGLGFTRSAVEAALAFSVVSALLWLADAVAACPCRKGKAERGEAEEQGGQGGGEGLRVMGREGTKPKGAQEMGEDGQGFHSLPPYSEVESGISRAGI